MKASSANLPMQLGRVKASGLEHCTERRKRVEVSAGAQQTWNDRETEAAAQQHSHHLELNSETRNVLPGRAGLRYNFRFGEI